MSEWRYAVCCLVCPARVPCFKDVVEVQQHDGRHPYIIFILPNRSIQQQRLFWMLPFMIQGYNLTPLPPDTFSSKGL